MTRLGWLYRSVHGLWLLFALFILLLIPAGFSADSAMITGGAIGSLVDPPLLVIGLLIGFAVRRAWLALLLCAVLGFVIYEFAAARREAYPASIEGALLIGRCAGAFTAAAIGSATAAIIRAGQSRGRSAGADIPATPSGPPSDLPPSSVE